ncbi:hypothetical protein RB195_026313 [Necator americanus]
MWWTLLLVVNAVNAQFNIFDDSSQHSSQITALGDNFGFRDALGAWSRVLRNMATRPQPMRVSPPNPRDFTIAPSIKREDLKLLREQKHNADNIINERLLYLLLPRIKGQSPFTTTASAITAATKPPVMMSTIFASKTTTAMAPTESVTSTTPVSRIKPTTTVTETTRTKKQYQEIKWSEEDMGEFRLNNSELAMLEKDYLRKLALLRIHRQARKNKHSVDYAKDDDGGEEIEEPPEMANITSTSDAQRIKNNRMDKNRFTAAFRNTSEEDFQERAKIETQIFSILNKTVEEQERKSSMAPERATFVEKTNNVEAAAEAPLRGVINEKGKDIEEFVEHSKAYAASLLSNQLIADPGATKYGTAGESEVRVTEGGQVIGATLPTATTNKHSSDKQQSISTAENVSALPTFTTTTERAGIKKVFSLTEAYEGVLKAEGSGDSEGTKRQHENTKHKITTFFQQGENATTTITPTTPKASMPSSETSTEAKAITTKRSTVQADISATDLARTDKQTSTPAFKQIPEAEEDYFSAVTDTEPSTTTHSSKRSTAVHNVHASASAYSEPKLAKVITPIAGIIDNIGPILAPLLRLRPGTAQAAAVRTYDTGVRDLDYSTSENSIIGYGTLLAREILNPGSLRKESEETQRALAAKIAQLKESVKHQSIGGGDTHTIPLREVISPTSQNIFISPLKSTNPKAFTQIASIPLAEQDGRNSQLSTLVRSQLPPYFIAPPPGYKGPLPPPPPPPPLLPVAELAPKEPKGTATVNTVNIAAQNTPSSSISDKPNFLPVVQTGTPSLVPDQSFTERSKRTLHRIPANHAADVAPANHYERDLPKVGSPLLEDSGLMVQGTPAELGLPLSTFGSFTSGGGGAKGFGGGRQPAESFDHTASADNPFPPFLA